MALLVVFAVMVQSHFQTDVEFQLQNALVYELENGMSWANGHLSFYDVRNSHHSCVLLLAKNSAQFHFVLLSNTSRADFLMINFWRNVKFESCSLQRKMLRAYHELIPYCTFKN